MSLYTAGNIEAEGAGMLFCNSQITVRFSPNRDAVRSIDVKKVLITDMRNVLAADRQATGVQSRRCREANG